MGERRRTDHLGEPTGEDSTGQPTLDRRLLHGPRVDGIGMDGAQGSPDRGITQGSGPPVVHVRTRSLLGRCRHGAAPGARGDRAAHMAREAYTTGVASAAFGSIGLATTRFSDAQDDHAPLAYASSQARSRGCAIRGSPPSGFIRPPSSWSIVQDAELG